LDSHSGGVVALRDPTRFSPHSDGVLALILIPRLEPQSGGVEALTRLTRSAPQSGGVVALRGLTRVVPHSGGVAALSRRTSTRPDTHLSIAIIRFNEYLVIHQNVTRDINVASETLNIRRRHMCYYYSIIFLIGFPSKKL
jgi:hypothetical protein